MVIYQYRVIYSDLVLQQFFVDNKLNLHFGDFNLSQYLRYPVFGYKKAIYCLLRDYKQSNTIISDFFALGSTLFEFVTGKILFAKLYLVEPKEIAQSNNHNIIYI